MKGARNRQKERKEKEEKKRKPHAFWSVGRGKKRTLFMGERAHLKKQHERGVSEKTKGKHYYFSKNPSLK